MKAWGLGIVLCLFASSAFAGLDTTRIYKDPFVKDLLPETGVSGYVALNSGDQIYVHVYNADSNLEPIVFLNGLSQDVSDWRALFPIIENSKRPLIFFDNLYQGRSLKKYLSDKKTKFPFTSPLGAERAFYGEDAKPLFKSVPITEQSQDIINLLDFLGVKTKVDLVGLSYGGGSALEIASTFSDRVRNVIMLAPYVGPLETQDQMIRAKVALLRKMYPISRYSAPEYYNELYDYFLRDLVYTTYYISEPSIIRWGFMQTVGAYELIRGIRHIVSADLVKTVPDHSIHLAIAGHDQYIPEKMLTDFWGTIPESKRGSILKVVNVEHKLNESVGPLIANYVLSIVDGTWENKGAVLSIVPEEGSVKNAKSEEVAFLGQTVPCEILLLRPSSPQHPNLPVNRIDGSIGKSFSRLPLSRNK